MSDDDPIADVCEDQNTVGFAPIASTALMRNNATWL
jgi:hypothetical protein